MGLDARIVDRLTQIPTLIKYALNIMEHGAMTVCLWFVAADFLQLQVEVGSWATETEQREYGNLLIREDSR